MAAPLNVVIVGNTAGLQAALAAASEEAAAFGDEMLVTGAKVDESTGAMGGAGKKLAAAFIGAFAVEKIAEFGKSLVEMGVNAQEQFGKLDVAMKNQGESLDKLRPAVDSLESSQRKLGFTNSETRDSLTKFTSAGQDVSEATKSMAEASDLARTKNESLGTATEQLIKVQAGNTRALKEFGIVLPPVTAAQDALKASGEDLTTVQGKQDLALAKVNDKMATGAEAAQILSDRIKGQADEFAKSAEGGIKQLGAQFDALKETMGTKLLPVVVAVTNALATGIPKALDDIKSAATGAFDFLDKITGGNAEEILRNIGIALGVVAVAFGVATAAEALFGVTLAVITSPVTLVVAAVAALAAGFTLLYEKSATVRDAVNDVVDALKNVWDDLTGAGDVTEKFTKALGDLGVSAGTAKTIIDDFKTVMGALGAVFDDVVAKVQEFGPSVLSAIGDAFSKIPDIVSAAFDTVKAVVTTGIAVVTAVWSDWGSTLTSVVKTAFDLVVTEVRDDIRIVGDVIAAISDVLQGKWGAAWGKLKDAVRTAFDEVKTVMSDAASILWALATKIGEDIVRLIVAGLRALGSLAWTELQALPQQLLRLDQAVVAAALAIGTKIVQEIVIGLRALASLAWQELQALPQQLIRLDGAVVGAAIAVGKAVVSEIISGLSALAGLAWAELQQLPAQLVRLAGVVVSEALAVGKIIVESIIQGLAGIGAKVYAVLQAIGSTLANVASEAFGWAEEVGKEIIRGIIGGLESLAQSAYDKIKSIAGGLKSAARGVLKALSPSQEFIDIGKDVMDGLTIGLDTNSKQAVDAMKKTAGAVKQAMTDAQPEIEQASKLIGVKATEGIVGGILGVQQTTAQQIKAALKQVTEVPLAEQALSPELAAAAKLIGPAAFDAMLAGFEGKQPAAKAVLQKLINDTTAKPMAEAALAPELDAAAKLVGQGAIDKMLAAFEGKQPAAKAALEQMIKDTTAKPMAVAADAPEIAAAANLLGDGAVKAIIAGFEGKQPTLQQQLKTLLAEASKKALDDAKAEVVTAGQDFASAFSTIFDNIKTVFSNAASNMPNPFRDALNAEQLADQAKQYQDAVDAAMKQLNDDTTAWAKKIGDDTAAVQKANDEGSLADQQKAEKQLADDQAAAAAALAADQDKYAAAQRSQQEYNLGLQADARDKANAKDQAAASDHLAKLQGLLESELPKQLTAWVKTHTDTSGEVEKFHASNFLAHSKAFGELLTLIQDELGKHNPLWVKVHEEILGTVAKYEKPIADAATKNAKALNDSTDTELGNTKDVVTRNLDDARGRIDDQGDLWAGAGANLGKRLADGLNSTVEAAGQAAGNIANKIAGFIKTGSPSKEGVFRMAPEVMGRKIAVDFTRGLSSGIDGINEAMSAMAFTGGGSSSSSGAAYDAGAAAGGAYAIAGGGGGGGATYNVTVNGVVGDTTAVAYKLRDEMLKIARREPDIFGGRA